MVAARAGDEAALGELLERYKPLVRARCRPYFLIGGDHEDVVQEGMIGLYKAIRDFQVQLGAPFRAFADLCVTRQIVTAIKATNRHKHGPLNSYVSLHRPVWPDGGDDRSLADILPASDIDPAELLVPAERLHALRAHLDTSLSEMEVAVLELFIEGKSYREIAVELRRHVKSIDNALQRIKRKLDAHLRAQALAEVG